MTYNPLTGVYKLDPRDVDVQLHGRMRSPGVSPGRPPHAVLFDLDGTLADTGKDLAYALNQTLQHFEQPTLPYDIIRPVRVAWRYRAYQTGLWHRAGKSRFRGTAASFCWMCTKTTCVARPRCFRAWMLVLADLESRQLPWGIVTNKPAWLTDPLIAAMQLEQRAGCVISGDTCSKRKPHPQPILHACELLDCEPDTHLVHWRCRPRHGGGTSGGLRDHRRPVRLPAP